MSTSKELLKAQEQGAEIRIMIAGEPTGGLVEYSPRYKGDRLAWAYREGNHVYRYTAAKCGAVETVNRDAQAADLAMASAEENATAEAATPVEVNKCTPGRCRNGCTNNPCKQTLECPCPPENIRFGGHLYRCPLASRVCDADCVKRGYLPGHASDCSLASKDMGEPVSAAVALTIGLNR